MKALKSCESADAVFIGAVGDQMGSRLTVRPEQGLLQIRKALKLYANLGPCSFYF